MPQIRHTLMSDDIDAVKAEPFTLGHLRRLVAAADALALPDHLPVGAGNWKLERLSVSYTDEQAAGRRPTDAVTERLQTPVRRPSIGDLR